tara:strand:+ start:1420 stop:2142 length:723 start_codon:yes stop_codon:yes gene_type:complete
MIVALQTARAGSKSVINKNIMLMGKKPMYRHALDKAIGSSKIDHVYVSTDIQEIINSDSAQYQAFERPQHLAQDDSSHQDVMIHGIDWIEKSLGAQVEIIVVLLGNSLGSSSKVLDDAIKMLQDNPDADSIVSVSEFNMFNPFRALKISGGLIETWLEQDKISEMKTIRNVNDKKSAGNIYFANGSFFICRRSAVLSKEGNLPFPWLGKKILPWVEEAAMEIDAPWQAEVLKSMLGTKNV